MAANLRINRPDVEQTSFDIRPNMPVEAHQTRHLFSPFINIDTRLDPVGFPFVRQGVIRSVNDFNQPAPNTKAINDAFHASVLQAYDVGWMAHERTAAQVAEGIIRTSGKTGELLPTGLVILRSLQGLDPRRSEDLEILSAIQEVLWPVNYETAHDHYEFLKGAEIGRLGVFGPEVVARVEKVRLQLIGEAIPGSEKYCQKLYDELTKELRSYAMHGDKAVGYRGQAGPEEQRACRWLSIPEPVRPVTALEGVSTANDLMALLAEQSVQSAAIMEQNQQMMQALLATIAGNQAKGESAEATGLLANFGEMMQRQAAAAEKQAEVTTKQNALLEKLAGKDASDAKTKRPKVAPDSASAAEEPAGQI